MTELPTSLRALADQPQGRRRRRLVGGLRASWRSSGPLVVGDPTAFVAVPHLPPSWRHLLGTTGQGQDVLAQTIAGARVTLAVGFTVGLLVTLVGALIGITARLPGRARRRRAVGLTNVFLVIPGLPLAIVLAAYLPPGARG